MREIKTRAKEIKGEENIPHHEALARASQEYGFASWEQAVARLTRGRKKAENYLCQRYREELEELAMALHGDATESAWPEIDHLIESFRWGVVGSMARVFGALSRQEATLVFSATKGPTIRTAPMALIAEVADSLRLAQTSEGEEAFREKAEKIPLPDWVAIGQLNNMFWRGSSSALDFLAGDRGAISATFAEFRIDKDIERCLYGR